MQDGDPILSITDILSELRNDVRANTGHDALADQLEVQYLGESLLDKDEDHMYRKANPPHPIHTTASCGSDCR